MLNNATKRLNLTAILFVAILSGCHSTPVNDATGDQDSASNRLITRFFEGIPSEPFNNAERKAESVYMQLLAMVGREDLNARVTSRPIGAVTCSDDKQLGIDVFAEIRDRAMQTRVVMINEAHDQPLHRHFIREVAVGLWESGYRVYAAETFSPFIEKSQLVPYTSVDDGYYSNEPVFGALVREVKRLGYRLTPYEHFSSANDASLSQHERVAIREEGQAENLATIVAGLGENERLLVHVGYSHSSEVPIPSFDGKDMAWMAVRFIEKTGIDPLTIDLTTCISSDDLIRVFNDAGRAAPGQFDMQIGHPAIEFEDGRPVWRDSLGAKRVDIPAALLDSNVRVIVEARPHGEPLDAVPADRIMLWPGERLPLLLEPGTYDVVSFREDGGAPGTAKTVIVH